MESAERTTFVSQYTKLVITAWSDEAVMNRLKASPLEVTREFGIDVPPDGTVSLVSEIPAEGDHTPQLDVQIRDWDQGKQTGIYILHVPDTPQLDTEELDEFELTSISGGRAPAGSVSGGASCSCCCCPCCCCT